MLGTVVGTQVAPEDETGVKGHIHRVRRGSCSPQKKTISVRNGQRKLSLDSFLSFDKFRALILVLINGHNSQNVKRKLKLWREID